MEFTLGELIIIIVAFIILTYYIFTVQQCKISDNKGDNKGDNKELISEEYIEDMNGNINDSVSLINMNSNMDGYNTFKKILDVNQYTSLNKSNVELWIPFFALDITVTPQDINKAKALSVPEDIFAQIIYPKILIKSLDLIKKLGDL